MRPLAVKSKSVNDTRMNAKKIIELILRTPFQTFGIRLTDGSRIRVDHPWQVATAANSPTCVFYGEDDEMRIISIRNITEIMTSSRDSLSDAS